MKIFVGFGYNERDQWIEKDVFPVLECMGFTIVHGKDMHGQELQTEVRTRIDQSDAAIGFFTVRDGQGDADFNSHIWVRDEMLYAIGKEKPVIPIKEDGARVPNGLMGDRQYIILHQNDRLACVGELVRTLGRRNIRRIRLEPETDDLRRQLNQLRRTQGFIIRYHTLDLTGLESEYKAGRLELVDQGFYLNVADVPRRAHVEVEGLLNGQQVFSSGWSSADAVMVKIG